MATRTLSQNVNQAISDFDSIKQAIIENGGEVPDGTPTSKYAELIEEISSDLSGFFDGTSTVIKIPKNATKIRDYCFYAYDEENEYYKSLTSVSMPDSVTSIEQRAFEGCQNLVSAPLPSSLTTIGDAAFYNCNKLILTSLPSGLTKIGDHAFDLCRSITIKSIPSGVTSIGINSFLRCDGITEITFEGKPDYIHSATFGCPNLTIVRVPWSQGEVSGAPWGASSATIVYNYTATE